MAAPRISFRPNHAKDKDGNFVNELRPILIEFYCRQFRIELSTGQRVYPANFISGRATSKEKDFRRLNSKLAQIESEVLSVWDSRGTRSAEEIKSLIRAAVRGESIPEEKKTVVSWIESFIEDAKVKGSTKQVYRATLNHLNEYAKSAKVTLTWDSFDLNFYQAFTDHLYGIGHVDNTVGKTIKTIKTFLSQSFERDLHTNLSFKKKGFKILQTTVDEIYLNESEIEKFLGAQVGADLIPSQKLFVFACDVGLRYGDYARLGPNNLVTTLDGHRLDVTTEKTGEDVKIALTERAKKIWDSWQGLPPRIPNPTFNEQIKTIAEAAKITEQTQSRTTIKGVVKIEWLPKFKMVTAHTARRSFATNAYAGGMPVKTIMSITGHKTEKAFNRYIRFTKTEHASIMQEYLKKRNDEAVMKKAN